MSTRRLETPRGLLIHVGRQTCMRCMQEAYDERWGVERIRGHRADLLVIDEPIRDAVQQMRDAQGHMAIGDEVMRERAHHIERHPPVGYVGMGTEPHMWHALYQMQPPDPKTEAIFGAQAPQRRSIIDGTRIPRDWQS